MLKLNSKHVQVFYPNKKKTAVFWKFDLGI